MLILCDGLDLIGMSYNWYYSMLIAKNVVTPGCSSEEKDTNQCVEDILFAVDQLALAFTDRWVLSLSPTTLVQCVAVAYYTSTVILSALGLLYVFHLRAWARAVIAPGGLDVIFCALMIMLALVLVSVVVCGPLRQPTDRYCHTVL